jgi:tetrahydrodipicolinate N-succinyltransferase
VVGHGAAIGAASTILPGVTIGDGALVGAGSVVTRAVEAGTVVAGNPARTIGKRTELPCYPGFFDHAYAWEDGMLHSPQTFVADVHGVAEASSSSE